MHALSHVSGRYARVPWMWGATVDVSTPGPARFLVALFASSLRYRLPARRGRAAATAARIGIPEAVSASLIRRLPAETDVALDALAARIRSVWVDLAARSDRLPPSPPQHLGVVRLGRASGPIHLVFGDEAHPILVAKPLSPATRHEFDALDRARPAAIAPRHLGVFDDMTIQEGLPGHAMATEPLDPARAATLPTPPGFFGLLAGLERLAATTARNVAPLELVDALEAAGRDGSLDATTATKVRRACDRVRAIDTSVLGHGDTSAQNCLVDDRVFTGLIDWELAKPGSAPGFDSWNAGIAAVEHGVGLWRWSEDRVVTAFSASWRAAPIFDACRRSARAAARAAGIDDEGAHAALEIGFFARRLARRRARPSAYPVGPDAAAKMLEIVCAS